MPARGWLPALALTLLMLGVSGPAATAQDGAITGSLTVLLPPPTGTGVQGLDFGSLTPGTPQEVLPTAPAAGQFRLDNVPRNKNVQLTFTLPVMLDRAGGGSGLPVFFDGPYARTCGNGCQSHTLVPTPAGGTEMTATAVHVRSIPYGQNSTTLDVHIGGRAEPAAEQPAGDYQGTIELTFALL